MPFLIFFLNWFFNLTSMEKKIVVNCYILTKQNLWCSIGHNCFYYKAISCPHFLPSPPPSSTPFLVNQLKVNKCFILLHDLVNHTHTFKTQSKSCFEYHLFINNLCTVPSLFIGTSQYCALSKDQLLKGLILLFLLKQLLITTDSVTPSLSVVILQSTANILNTE